MNSPLLNLAWGANTLVWGSDTPLWGAGFTSSPAGARGAVRINGTLYVGTYQHIDDMVRRHARAQATGKDATSRTQAKRQARAAVRTGLKLTVESPIVLPGQQTVDVANAMFRDLRDAFTESYIDATLARSRSMAIKARMIAAIKAEQIRRAQIEQNNMIAIKRAEELLLG